MLTLKFRWTNPDSQAASVQARSHTSRILIRIYGFTLQKSAPGCYPQTLPLGTLRSKFQVSLTDSCGQTIKKFISPLQVFFGKDKLQKNFDKLCNICKIYLSTDDLSSILKIAFWSPPLPKNMFLIIKWLQLFLKNQIAKSQ